MARNRQPDLFLSDTEPEMLDDRPEHVYRADPEEVRQIVLPTAHTLQISKAPRSFSVCWREPQA